MRRHQDLGNCSKVLSQKMAVVPCGNYVLIVPWSMIRKLQNSVEFVLRNVELECSYFQHILRNFCSRCHLPLRNIYIQPTKTMRLFLQPFGSNNAGLAAQASLTCRNINHLCLPRLRNESLASTCFRQLFRVCFCSGERSPILLCGKRNCFCLVLVSFMQ